MNSRSCGWLHLHSFYYWACSISTVCWILFWDFTTGRVPRYNELFPGFSRKSWLHGTSLITCLPSTCLLNPIQAESLRAHFPASIWPYIMLLHLGGSGSWEVLGMGRWVSGSFAGEAVYLTEEFLLLWHYSLFLHQLFSGLLNILLCVFPASLLPTHLSPHSLQNWHCLLNCSNDGKCFEQWVWVCHFSTASLRNLGQIMYPSGMQFFTCKLGMLDYMKSKVVLAL